MQREHEFHTEGPDLFPPPDTLDELPPAPGNSSMGTPIEVAFFYGEPFELRGVQGYIDFEKLDEILTQSKDEGIKAIRDAMWTLVTEDQGGEEGFGQWNELDQQMVERADALDPDVFVALEPSVRTMVPLGVESPMVCPMESEPPLVGGDPATWSPYALDGSLVHTSPPAPAQVEPAYTVIAV